MLAAAAGLVFGVLIGAGLEPFVQQQKLNVLGLARAED
jgi:hypothetical protein